MTPSIPRNGVSVLAGAAQTDPTDLGHGHLEADTGRAVDGADDLDPVSSWSEARVNPLPDPAVGPVQIVVSYTIASERDQAWLTAMQQMRRSRLRTGATRWELYRDAEHPDRFVEQFWVPTREEHQRQHDGRLTGADRTVEQAALGFSDP